MVRVVLDTDVVLSGFISPHGASRQLLIGALQRRFGLLLSTPLLLEYEAVLGRSEHLARADLGGMRIAEILEGLEGVCLRVVFDYVWRPTGAHADDELVVGTAINGSADVIATFNIKDMKQAGERFGFAVQRPGVVLRRIVS